MLWAVFTVALYGFFRASELLQTKRSDFTPFPTQMSINLQHSKTDPFQLFKYFQLARLYAPSGQ